MSIEDVLAAIKQFAQPQPTESKMPLPTKAELLAESDAQLVSAREVLERHGNQESNISIHSGYWDMMNRFRALRAEAAMLPDPPAEPPAEEPPAEEPPPPTP